MRFHNVIKSMEYVTFPIILELNRISKSLSDSYVQVFNILVSAFLGRLFEITPIACWVIQLLQHSDNVTRFVWLERFLSDINAKTYLSMFFMLIVFATLSFIRWIKRRIPGNKKTVADRDRIVFEFYKCGIAELFSIRSLIEQYTELDEKEESARYLLLAQLKYEITELIYRLDKMNILELEKVGIVKTHSREIIERIGEDVYIDFMDDLLKQIETVVEGFVSCGKQGSLETLFVTLSTSNCYYLCKYVNKFDNVYQHFQELSNRIKKEIKL